MNGPSDNTVASATFGSPLRVSDAACGPSSSDFGIRPRQERKQWSNRWIWTARDELI